VSEYKVLALYDGIPQELKSGDTAVISRPLWYGERGIMGGGEQPDWGYSYNVIEYITIATTGNSSDYGDLLQRLTYITACSSGTRGIFSCGFNLMTGNVSVNVIQYKTIASSSNAVDFGDYSTEAYGLCSVSNYTRGLIAGTDNRINYITIMSFGNTVDFGDMAIVRYNTPAAISNGTRGHFCGGTTTGNVKVNNIDYVTIMSLGNSVDFGDITQERISFYGLGDLVRGICAGGQKAGDVGSNVIDYITFSIASNATDFGDLVSARFGVSATNNGSRGIISGGHGTNVIEYITIQTIGNTTDFGDLISRESGYPGIRFSGSCSGN